MNCRGCDHPLDPSLVVCDLGALPLANALCDTPSESVMTHPLRPVVCDHCLLVQLPDVVDADVLFPHDYPFFAGQSARWLRHCRDLADKACERFRLGPTSRVLDIGSNDGSMLRRFRGRGIPAIGVEPSENVAQHALMEGLPTIIDRWGLECAERLLGTTGVPPGKGWRADLIIATNVLAHVEDLHDFLLAVRMVLAPGGHAIFEVPYVGNMIRDGSWDQIYAEHGCYFGVASLDAALERAGLRLVDVELVDVHGGSLRATATSGEPLQGIPESVMAMINAEGSASLHRIDTYLEFAKQPPRTKRHVWQRLLDCEGKRIVGYGASAKATTLLNYCGIDADDIPFIADTTPSKHGRYVPGTRIQIKAHDALGKADPDVVALFAWNWAPEAVPKIKKQCPRAEVVSLRPAESPGSPPRIDVVQAIARALA